MPFVSDLFLRLGHGFAGGLLVGLGQAPGRFGEGSFCSNKVFVSPQGVQEGFFSAWCFFVRLWLCRFLKSRHPCPLLC